MLSHAVPGHVIARKSAGKETQARDRGGKGYVSAGPAVHIDGHGHAR